jgi:hypothetical protein
MYLTYRVFWMLAVPPLSSKNNIIRLVLLNPWIRHKSVQSHGREEKTINTLCGEKKVF